MTPDLQNSLQLLPGQTSLCTTETAEALPSEKPPLHWAPGHLAFLILLQPLPFFILNLHRAPF